MLQPKTLDQISSIATSLFKNAQLGSKEKLCKTKGTWRVKPSKSVIGKTISHNASGDRTLICWGEPAKIRPNTLVKLNAVKALTKSTTPTNQGWVDHKASASCSNAQKLPNGGQAIKPSVPTIKAIPETGRRDHSPPSWVKSWVMLFQITPPVVITNNPIARA